MRLPRVQFTIAQLMVLIAVVGLLLGIASAALSNPGLIFLALVPLIVLGPIGLQLYAIFSRDTPYCDKPSESNGRIIEDVDDRPHGAQAMRLPRMTTRRWMVVVAAEGIGVGGWIQIVRWGRLREYYELLAEMHVENASHFRQDADRTRDEWLSECRRVDEENRLREQGLKKSMFTLYHPLDPDEGRRAVAHFERLRRVYERAARYPWLPVEPDPPGPE